MENFVEWVNKYQVLIATIINLVFFLIVLLSNFSIKRKLNKFRFLVKNNEDQKLEELLLEIGERSKEVEKNLRELQVAFEKNLIKEETHIQNCGVVRFQAFHNTGGDQSFALALLDAKGNGVVLSSLFGRDESRVYCKPVEACKSSYALSKEELEAIKKATTGINNDK
ncbi:MAG TPA: DUF4446 family protein [Bacillota bacterium]|jgi:hypothetical protein|nr:DUF4446 family protein [Bacillota bacterium]HOL10257.1 DUF4446 family protein [Bacillota bacterium]